MKRKAVGNHPNRFFIKFLLFRDYAELEAVNLFAVNSCIVVIVGHPRVVVFTYCRHSALNRAVGVAEQTDADTVDLLAVKSCIVLAVFNPGQPSAAEGVYLILYISA